MPNKRSAWISFWHFMWYSNSVWSWVLNIIVAFVLIKFLVYPGIGLILGTTHPIVAVVSESMDHRALHPCKIYDASLSSCIKRYETKWELCGVEFSERQKVGFDFYWENCGPWYERNHNITKAMFEKFHLKNGFRRGDIIVLRGKEPKDIQIGDIIVFIANKQYPIIHRVVEKKLIGGKWYFSTKGDHNKESFDDTSIAEVNISEDRVLGVAMFKIPWLGYVKIKFVDLISFMAGRSVEV